MWTSLFWYCRLLVIVQSERCINEFDFMTANFFLLGMLLWYVQYFPWITHMTCALLCFVCGTGSFSHILRNYLVLTLGQLHEYHKASDDTLKNVVTLIISVYFFRIFTMTLCHWNAVLIIDLCRDPTGVHLQWKDITELWGWFYVSQTMLLNKQSSCWWPSFDPLTLIWRYCDVVDGLHNFGLKINDIMSWSLALA